MKRLPRTTRLPILGFVLLSLAACGGGGGGGNGGGNNGGGGGVTPPPPPASQTYSVALTGVTLTDRQTDDAVAPSGLPIAGATATRNP